MFAGLEALAADGSVSSFAQANGLRYQRRSRPPALSGGPFELYTNAKVRGSVSGPGWVAGNLDAGDGIVRRQSTFFGVPVTSAAAGPLISGQVPPIGYLALTLSQQLPNMILDSKRNDPSLGSSLLHPPSLDQRLSLEGDFDTHFDLFVPSGYESDALFIFTPDLMALLIDEAGDCDVEIRGNQLVIYAGSELDLSRADTWRWIERIMSVVGAKTFSRTQRYTDDRVTGDMTPAAHRLRRRLGSGQIKNMVFLVIVIAAFLAAGLAVVLFNSLAP